MSSKRNRSKRRLDDKSKSSGKKPPRKRRRKNNSKSNKENEDPNNNSNKKWTEEELLKLVTYGHQGQWFTSGHIQGHRSNIDEIKNQMGSTRSTRAIQKKFCLRLHLNDLLVATH